MKEYRIERLDDKNIKDLNFLFLEAFHIKFPIDYIKKKFNTDIWGAKYIAYIAYDNNNLPASFYAVFPVNIIYKGKKYLVAQVGDLMTHGNHRRKGLFVKLGNLTHELAKKQGIKLIFTFPHFSNSSYLGFTKKLNFIHNESFNNYNIRIPTLLPILRICKKYTILNVLYSIYSKFILGVFYKLYKSFSYNIANNEYGEIEKDEQYFNYKSYTQSYIVSIKNTRVWFKLTEYGSMCIGDIEKKNYDDILKTLNHLKKMAKLLGVRNIHFEVSSGSYLDNILKRHYEYNNNFHICLLKLDNNIPAENFKFVFGDFDNF